VQLSFAELQEQEEKHQLVVYICEISNVKVWSATSCCVNSAKSWCIRSLTAYLTIAKLGCVVAGVFGEGFYYL